MDTTNTRGYIALLATLLVLGSCEGASQPTRQQPAAQPAPETLTEIQSRRIGLDRSQPLAIAKAKGRGVWVTAGQGRLLRLQNARIVERYPIDSSRVGITATADRVWLSGGGDGGSRVGMLLGVNPQKGDVVQRVRFPGVSAYGVDASTAGIFVALFNGDLARVHPGGDNISRIPLGYGLTHLVATGNVAWVSSPQRGKVWRVEVHRDDTNAAAIDLRRRDNKSCPQGSDASPRAIWVADPCAGLVWLLDRETGEVLGRLNDVGRRPVDVDVSRGWAWVVSMRDRVVTAMDAKNLKTIGRAKAGPGALSILARGHQAWVTNTENYSLTYLWTEGQPD